MPTFEYFKHLSKSFKYNVNRRGPRQEPWGIPHVASLFLDFFHLGNSIVVCYVVKIYLFAD